MRYQLQQAEGFVGSIKTCVIPTADCNNNLNRKHNVLYLLPAPRGNPVAARANARALFLLSVKVSVTIVIPVNMVKPREQCLLTLFMCSTDHKRSYSVKERCYTWSPKTAVYYILFHIFLTRPSWKKSEGLFWQRVQIFKKCAYIWKLTSCGRAEMKI